MRSFKQIPASQIGIRPLYTKGFEKHGLLYFSNEYHPVESYGAQCGNCHIIVWITGRDDPILFEPVPVEYSQDGEKYRKYRKNKLKRFLASLLPCLLARIAASKIMIYSLIMLPKQDMRMVHNLYRIGIQRLIMSCLNLKKIN